MICFIKERVQCFSLFVIVMISLVSTLDIQSAPAWSTNFAGNHLSYKMATEDEFGSEDEQLVADILKVVARLYKGMIDVSALYFSGMIVNQEQLFQQVLFEVGKECFEIIKLLAQYGPRMLHSPKISWVDKTKKTMYILSFLVVFWALIAYERARYRIRSTILIQPNCAMSPREFPSMNVRSTDQVVLPREQ